jgi:hypothetical protein
MSKNTDLVPISSYAISKHDPARLAALVQQNLGGERIDEFALDRIRVPAGGGTRWTVPTLEGEQEVPELEGVVIGWRPGRAYWKESLEESGGGSPPDCSSDDGVFGQGDPGGDCEACPMSQWGSSPKGTNAQACKAFRLLFLMRPQDLLPVVVVVPPSSLRGVQNYLLRLTSNGLGVSGVISRFGLTKAKSQGGIAYAEILPSLAMALQGEELARVTAAAEALAPFVSKTRTETIVS